MVDLVEAIDECVVLSTDEASAKNPTSAISEAAITHIRKLSFLLLQLQPKLSPLLQILLLMSPKKKSHCLLRVKLMFRYADEKISHYCYHQFTC